MDGGGLTQMGGNQLTFEAIMTPNALYFVITLAVIGYLYYTKMILSKTLLKKNQQIYLINNYI